MVLLLTILRDKTILKKALVSVCSKSYLEGTRLMFYSFLKHHEGSEIELIVIHDDLDEKDQKNLAQWFGVECIFLEKRLSKALELLSQKFPNLNNRVRRFYSLQTFNMDYDSILFVDSDVLFNSNVSELFDLEYPISACLDWHSLKAGKRNLIDFSSNSKDTLYSTFNAGVVHIRLDKIEQETYNQLLGRLQSTNFKKLESGHTDQFILNQHFAANYNQIEKKYNRFVLAKEKDIRYKKEEDMAIIHYLRHPKPWKRKAWVKRVLKGKKPPVQLVKWHQLNLSFYKEMEIKMSLQNRLLSAIILLTSFRDKSK